MYKFALVILVSTLVFTTATNVKKCENGLPLPSRVDVKDCIQPPCNVTKGTTATMDVQFVGTRDNITSVKAQVSATALGITAPYILPEKIANVCLNLSNGATCPINKNESVVYNFNFFVGNYPTIPVAVTMSLVDENNVDLFCFVCDIIVIKGAD